LEELSDPEAIDPELDAEKDRATRFRRSPNRPAAHTTRAFMAGWPGVTLRDRLDALLSPSIPGIVTVSPFPSSSRGDNDEGADEEETDGDREAGVVVSASVLVFTRDCRWSRVLIVDAGLSSSIASEDGGRIMDMAMSMSTDTTS
jgi:hypothetical protein